MPRARTPRGQYVRRPPADEDAAIAADVEALAASEQKRHAESPRERAARRASEIIGHLEGALDEGQDDLALDNLSIDENWSYEWKRQTVYGKSDPSYDTRLARTGWETVPATRHPHMMPKGHRGAITRDGLVLMERPKQITDRVKQIMHDRALGAVRLKEKQLNEAPDGTFDRVDQRGRPMAQVRTSHSPIEIPVPIE